MPLSACETGCVQEGAQETEGRQGSSPTKDNSGLALSLSFSWKTDFTGWLVPLLRRSCQMFHECSVGLRSQKASAVQPLVKGPNPGILGQGLAHSPCTCTYTQ